MMMMMMLLMMLLLLLLLLVMMPLLMLLLLAEAHCRRFNWDIRCPIPKKKHLSAVKPASSVPAASLMNCEFLCARMSFLMKCVLLIFVACLLAPCSAQAGVNTSFYLDTNCSTPCPNCTVRNPIITAGGCVRERLDVNSSSVTAACNATHVIGARTLCTFVVIARCCPCTPHPALPLLLFHPLFLRLGLLDIRLQRIARSFRA
jgi:hypothetical protein